MAPIVILNVVILLLSGNLINLDMLESKNQQLNSQLFISNSSNSSSNSTVGESWSENVGINFNLDLNSGNFHLTSHSFPVGENEDSSGIYSSMLKHIDIYDSNLGINYSLGVEITSNTLPCRNATSNHLSQLLFFSSDDGTIYGNGWHWPTISGNNNISWNISYTFFAPSKGWIASVNTYYQNNVMKFNTSLKQLNYSKPWLKMELPNINHIGINQYNYDLIRINLLYHNSTITNLPLMCKIVNEANTFFRQRGIFISVEEFLEVNPNNHSEQFQLNWNSPNGICNNDTLRTSIYNHKLTNTHFNWYFDHIDSYIYLYVDDGSNHDGLNWNVGSTIGCATNRYWDESINIAGQQGVGDAWVLIHPNSQSSINFTRYFAILLAHEIGHTLGASHHHSEASWRGSPNNGNCGGDDTDDGFPPTGIATSEGDYRSIMIDGMNYDLVECYGVPYFSNQTYDYWLNNGSLRGLRYKQIQPSWHNWSKKASEHGPQLEYWFAQIDNHQVIDSSSPIQQIWKISYSTRIINNSSPLGQTNILGSCSNFVGIRTLMNSTYLEHYDAWQGYRRFSPCDEMRFSNGEYINHWSQNLWITGLEDYDGDQPPDDFEKHQYSSKSNLTTQAIWVIWPAYHQSVVTNTYGPWQWMGLTWEQMN